MTIDEIATQIVDASLQIHRAIGPGMLESAYEAMLEHELKKRGLQVQRQIYLGLDYGDLHVERAYCLDLLVNRSVIIEVKSVEAISAVHIKQLLTYLKLMSLEVGFLLNFGQVTLKAGGIRRIMNSAPKISSEMIQSS